MKMAIGTMEINFGILAIVGVFVACMEALINIGKPSVHSCLDLLATEDGQTRRELAVKVIRYVEGAEVAEPDALRKARLENALDQLKQLPKSFFY